VRTDIIVGDLRIGNSPRNVAIAPDGTRVYATNDQALFVIDTAPQSIDTSILITNPTAVAVTPDSRRVYVASGDTLVVLDATAHVVVPGITVGDTPVSIAIADVLTGCGPAPCAGDCTGDGVVTVGELLTLVGIALENIPVSACTAGDINRNGAIAVDEIVSAVRVALNGCAAG